MALFFRLQVPPGELINRLDAEAAAVADTVFGLTLRAFDYVEKITFVDNNVSLSWLTTGCSVSDDVDPLLASL